MNKREAAIIMAFTGIRFGSFSNFHNYAEEKFQRSIFTHEMSEEFYSILKELVREDFINLHNGIKDDCDCCECA